MDYVVKSFWQTSKEICLKTVH